MKLLLTAKFSSTNPKKVDSILKGVELQSFERNNLTKNVSEEEVIEFYELVKSFKPDAIFVNFPTYIPFKKDFWENYANENLKMIQTFSIGYDHIDDREAKKRGVWVCNASAGVDVATAETCMFLILSCLKRAHRWMTSINNDVTNWTREKNSLNPYLLPENIHGKTLGIIGYGTIGQKLVKMAKGFGMKILYFKRTRLSKEEEGTLGVEYRTMDALLSESDVVSLNCPLTTQTKHLITKTELEKMKKTSFLVNTARGGVVNELDLMEALKNKTIQGAGLDVFEQEPLDPERLKELNDLGCVCLPHIGGFSRENFGLLDQICLENFRLFLVEHQKPKTIVNE